MKIAKLLNKKLNTRGASIVVALVVFIICSFVAVAIVNSAILNAQRTAAEKREEIAYSATTQAMMLISECIESDASYRYEQGVSANDENNTIVGMEEEFGEKIRAMAEQVASGHTEATKNIHFGSSGVEDKLHGTLKGKITMKPNFTIMVDVWIENGKGDYPLTLTIPGSSETVKEDKLGTKTESGQYEQKDVTYISWSKSGMYITGKKKASNP